MREACFAELMTEEEVEAAVGVILSLNLKTPANSGTLKFMASPEAIAKLQRNSIP